MNANRGVSRSAEPPPWIRNKSSRAAADGAKILKFSKPLPPTSISKKNQIFTFILIL
jgi:hypothetical protein